jgi:hypothetical protein
MAYWKLGLCVAMACGAGVSASIAQQLNPQQIQTVRDTAASICNTVKEAKGHKSDVQIQGDVKAQLGGLVGKVADVGGSGKGAIDREEFEGLSRDATATALQGDRDCRERLFNKMFDQLTAAQDPRATSGTGAYRTPPAPTSHGEMFPAAPGMHIDSDGRIVSRDTYRPTGASTPFGQLPFPCVDKAGNVVAVVGPAPGGLQGACGQR